MATPNGTKASARTTYAPTFKVYAASAVVDCVADSPDKLSTARKVVPLAAGSFSSLKDIDGTEQAGAGITFLAGFVAEGEVSGFTCSAACVVYWGRVPGAAS